MIMKNYLLIIIPEKINDYINFFVLKYYTNFVHKKYGLYISNIYILFSLIFFLGKINKSFIINKILVCI